MRFLKSERRLRKRELRAIFPHSGNDGGLMNSSLSRRRVLKGILNSSAVTVALPLLDCCLNDNGNAFADGTPLPLRYGTWFWGLGIAQKAFVPTKIGAD